MKKALVILIMLGLLLINVVSVSAKDSGTPIKNQGIDYTWIEKIDFDTRHIKICYNVLMWTYCFAPLYVPQDAILTFHGPVELEDLPTEGWVISFDY